MLDEICERRKEGRRETAVREDRKGDNKRREGRESSKGGMKKMPGEGRAIGVSELSNPSSKGPPRVTSSDSVISSPAPGLACNCACLSLPEWPFLGGTGPAVLLSIQLIAFISCIVISLGQCPFNQVTPAGLTAPAGQDCACIHEGCSWGSPQESS